MMTGYHQIIGYYRLKVGYRLGEAILARRAIQLEHRLREANWRQLSDYRTCRAYTRLSSGYGELLIDYDLTKRASASANAQRFV